MKPVSKITFLLGALLIITACGSSTSLASSSSDNSSEASATTSYFSYDSNTSYQPYVVTFVTNCETELDPITTSIIETMPTLENGELTLEGWYFDDDFTAYVNFPLFVDQNLTLYAHWITASDGFIYTPTLDGQGYIVEAYTGNATNIALPSTYNSKPVLEIGEYLFYNNGSLTSIVLPSQLKTIAMAAFKNVTLLESIILPSTLTTLATDAFSGASALETISFGSSLRSIGNNAFEGCSSLTSIDLPSDLVEINARAFADNESLTSVTLRPLTPPLRYANSFENSPSNLRFYVSSSVLNIYKSDPSWVAYADVIFSL